ncbi:MarR family transcriptional regulator, partial [Periweissella fabaria]|nr:MarR family transcriptional regulator [Periweissella fabaria]
SLLEVQKQTQNLLDQQQRLALQDKKILEEYKAEITDLKALNIPKQGSEKDDVIPKENIVKDPQKENKKWWHFGIKL